MRHTIVLILFATLQFVFTYGQNNIDIAFENFRGGDAMRPASISFQVIDVATGAAISSWDANRTLPTASTAKLFSTATALDILGPNYRPKTRFYYEGSIDSSGRLIGNIWIRGGGDPSIGSRFFCEDGHELDEFKHWAEAIKSLGITSIDGNIIADASEFGYEGAPTGWSWNDMGNYYGAGPSGLTVYDNMVKYYFNCSSVPGKTTVLKTIQPFVPDLVFHNYVVSSERAGDNAYLYGAPFSNERFGIGTLPVSSANFLVKGSLPDPEKQFAFEFREMLIEKGIMVSGIAKGAREIEYAGNNASYEQKTLLFAHDGAKLIDIIDYTNMRSVNLFAEHLINLIGYEKKRNGSTSSGLSVLENHWENKINTAGLHVNDGSGLSRSNAISANHFTELLKYMNSSTYSSQFWKSLPVSGVSGTMRNFCDGQAAHGKIWAKSGSMNRIKSYAGYVKTNSGKTLAFALIVTNFEGGDSALKQKMETLFNQFVAY